VIGRLVRNIPPPNHGQGRHRNPNSCWMALQRCRGAHRSGGGGGDGRGEGGGFLAGGGGDLRGGGGFLAGGGGPCLGGGGGALMKQSPISVAAYVRDCFNACNSID